MAKLIYANIIDQDKRYRDLANLGVRLNIDTVKLMPRLIELAKPEHLVLIADARSILDEDGFWLATTDDERRYLIKKSYDLHRYKGTPWAIREICRRLGFGEIELTEGVGLKSWAHYRVVINHTITNTQALRLRKTLAAFAPARCVLEALDYQATPLYYNQKANFDGEYNFGTA